MSATVQFIVPPQLLQLVKFVRRDTLQTQELNLSLLGIQKTFEVNQFACWDLDQFQGIDRLPEELAQYFTGAQFFVASISVLSGNAADLVGNLLELGIPAATEFHPEEGYSGSMNYHVHGFNDGEEDYIEVTMQQGYFNEETGENVEGQRIVPLSARWL